MSAGRAIWRQEAVTQPFEGIAKGGGKKIVAAEKVRVAPPGGTLSKQISTVAESPSKQVSQVTELDGNVETMIALAAVGEPTELFALTILAGALTVAAT